MDSRPRDPEFEITVLTGTADGLELSNELRQVKAALLYADRVRLVSPTVAMLEMFATIADGSDSQLIERLLAMTMPADLPHGAELVEGLHRRHGRQRTREQIAFDWRMRSMAASQRNAFEQYAEQLKTQPEVAELHRARDAGVLELDGLGLDAIPIFSDFALQDAGIPHESHSEEYAVKLVERMVGFIGPSESTYPLLDGSMIDLVREFDVAMGSKTDAAGATEPHLAASFIGRMRSFPDAGIDEILDVRRELAVPLVRFRSAVAGMAREIAETPLDAGFAGAADALYREMVAPALLEIGEIEEERGIARQLVKQATIGEAKPDLAATVATVGTVGLAATQYSSLPALAATIAGLSGPALSSAYNLYAAVKKERDRLASERKTNKFLFLVEADRKLAGNRRH
jgi:predicted transcriptional regulator